MENKLLRKMIRNCFIQYQHDLESVPLSEEDYIRMTAEITEILQTEETDVFEVVNDVVYEYLSQ
ncbi:YqzH family protein [Sutcliffiella sp. NPDC057660]|uniref:YqzH family protein n=1 Tax=Sutcliffiella sp. NPDC057660 TaxID=3346199 RepID=UPI0036B37B53